MLFGRVLFHTPTEGDHSKSVPDFIDAGIPVLADESVFNSYGINSPGCIIANHQHEYKFGDFCEAVLGRTRRPYFRVSIKTPRNG